MNKRLVILMMMVSVGVHTSHAMRLSKQTERAIQNERALLGWTSKYKKICIGCGVAAAVGVACMIDSLRRRGAASATESFVGVELAACSMGLVLGTALNCCLSAYQVRTIIEFCRFNCADMMFLVDQFDGGDAKIADQLLVKINTYAGMIASRYQSSGDLTAAQLAKLKPLATARESLYAVATELALVQEYKNFCVSRGVYDEHIPQWIELLKKVITFIEQRPEFAQENDQLLKREALGLAA